MAADQLLRDRVQGIVDAKLAFFGRHLGEEDGLEHQVAQFFGQAGPIALIDGIEDFVGFFEQIGLDGVEVLFAVPGQPPGARRRSMMPTKRSKRSPVVIGSCGIAERVESSV